MPGAALRAREHVERGIEGGKHGIVGSLENPPIMPARRVTIPTAVARIAVAASLGAVASCAPANGRDAAACDAVRPTAVTTARCAVDAQRSETRADHTTGIEHAEDLTRAASEWRKAAAGGTAAPESRRRLAHAMVLDERVQDDPTAPAALRAQAKRDEQLARTALLRTR